MSEGCRQYAVYVLHVQFPSMVAVDCAGFGVEVQVFRALKMVPVGPTQD